MEGHEVIYPINTRGIVQDSVHLSRLLDGWPPTGKQQKGRLWHVEQQGGGFSFPKATVRYGHEALEIMEHALRCPE